MTLIEAVDARRSRRKYITTPIEPASLEKLQALISQYNQDAGPNMRFVLEDGTAFAGLRKSYGMFTGVRNYIGLIDNPNDENRKEKLGYYGELIVLAATMLGLGTCWVGGSFDRKSCPFELEDGESVACVITVGNPAPELGFREKLIAGLTHRKVKKAGDMFTAEGDTPDWFMAGMHSVEKAPSAAMRQPVKFTYDGGTVTASVPDISNVGAALDLGIAKAHFEIGAGSGKWEWGNGARFTKRDDSKPQDEPADAEPEPENPVQPEPKQPEPPREEAPVGESTVSGKPLADETVVNEEAPADETAVSNEPLADETAVNEEPSDAAHDEDNG